MNWSTNLYLRWGATAAIVLLMIVLGLRWAAREPSDATSLLASAPAAGALLEPVLEPAPASAASTAQPASGEVAGTALIAVDVIGAVAAPGVYRLPPAARVDDAIAAAGGLAPDANRERINLAAPLEDGIQIRVPHVDESAAAMPEEQAAAPAQGAERGAVDINTADAATLESLPGIGPATAAAIVAYREANGPFGSVDDLQNVKGIGPSLFGKLAGLVTVGE